MLRLVATLVVLLIGSTAESFEARAQQSADGRKTIGVISTIGDTFAVQTLGLMIFTNDTKEISVDKWGINDRVVAKVNALIGKRFAVQKINFQKGAFAEMERATSNPFGDAMGTLRSRVRSISANQHCDLYLVIWRASTPFGTSPMQLNGLGMIRNSGIVGGVHLHALSAVTVVDGHTFEILRNERSTIGQNTFLADIKGPNRDLDETFWPVSGQVTGNEKLKAATWALLEQSLTVTIPTLFQTK